MPREPPVIIAVFPGNDPCLASSSAERQPRQMREKGKFLEILQACVGGARAADLREPLPDNQRNDDGDDAGVDQDAAKHRTVTVECASSLVTRINIECGDV